VTDDKFKETPKETPKDCEQKHWWSSPTHKWGEWKLITLANGDGKPITQAQKRVCSRCGRIERDYL
jgi:hypothetical protein